MMLGLDTSGKNLGLAVCNKGEVITSSLTQPGLRHGEILQQRIDGFLSGSNLSLDDLTGVSVTLGPGSFTGLRIGLAAAKGYCYALNIPLTGISTLSAGAGFISPKAAKTAVIIDAMRDEFYYALFDSSGPTPRRLIPDSVGPMANLYDIIDDKTIIFGPEHLMEQFVAQFDHSDYHISDSLNLAETAGLIGEENAEIREYLEMAEAIPIYLRSGI
ncbi:MAG: tRNA (adenosine(37)-N6)-threonylcarbamoyltransferase complex dimerization subunit type 1 TsaB [candidate division Zixibacteria bacterium]|nr:tRNA (adenosine(37)-N6)-threonylcarbamoyltransferase complex dimerization subunit type 1 TsaB [candidate division Zixibacteria bacterium]